MNLLVRHVRGYDCSKHLRIPPLSLKLFTAYWQEPPTICDRALCHLWVRLWRHAGTAACQQPEEGMAEHGQCHARPPPIEVSLADGIVWLIRAKWWAKCPHDLGCLDVQVAWTATATKGGRLSLQGSTTETDLFTKTYRGSLPMQLAWNLSEPHNHSPKDSRSVLLKMRCR